MVAASDAVVAVATSECSRSPPGEKIEPHRGIHLRAEITVAHWHWLQPRFSLGDFGALEHRAGTQE